MAAQLASKKFDLPSLTPRQLKSIDKESISHLLAEVDGDNEDDDED